MRIVPGRPEGSAVRRGAATFTGDVWLDQVLQEAGAVADGVSVNTVTFTPQARTYWHSHVGGQILHVTSGEGWVGQRGEPGRRIRAGDTVWAPPGEEHWHGATDGTVMVHIAVSLGTTDWFEEVADRQGG